MFTIKRCFLLKFGNSEFLHCCSFLQFIFFINIFNMLVDGRFCFFEQWQVVHAYAAAKGIEILGDMPLFVAPQSADVWAHQEIFLLDTEGNPSLRAGVPPDYFAKDGQLWGNPLYNWQACARENYQWWIERCRTLSLLVDVVRLDHFRGFVACWGVEPAATTAPFSMIAPLSTVAFTPIHT